MMNAKLREDFDTVMPKCKFQVGFPLLWINVHTNSTTVPSITFLVSGHTCLVSCCVCSRVPPGHRDAALQDFDEDVDGHPPVGVEETPVLLSQRGVQDPDHFEKDVGLN